MTGVQIFFESFMNDRVWMTMTGVWMIYEHFMMANLSIMNNILVFLLLTLDKIINCDIPDLTDLGQERIFKFSHLKISCQFFCATEFYMELFSRKYYFVI